MRLLTVVFLSAMVLGFSSMASAVTILGTGTAALLGSDLTDPQNDGDVEADINYEATFAASEEPTFGGSEGAFNVFENQVGGGNQKFCCGDQNNFPVNPITIDATLDVGAIRLSHFTVTSGNDTPARDPLDWEIQGSNDGVNFTSIFSSTSPTTIWTDRDQVLRFDAGTDFPVQSTAYSTFRFVAYETGLTTGARFQLGELEYFAIPEPSSFILAAIALCGLALRCRIRL